MAGFQFPEYPGLKRDNPFQDSAGRNPFADEVPVYETHDDNLYGATPAATVVKQEVAWEAVLSDRRRPILLMGVSGCAVGLLGLTLSVWARWNDATALVLVSSLPISFLALALSVPAVWHASQDLRAMRVHAMAQQGRRVVRWGWWLGCVGLLSSLFVISMILLAVVIDENLI